MGGSEGEGIVERARAWWRWATLGLLAVTGIGILIALFAIQANANAQRDRALALQTHSYDVMVLSRSLSTTIAKAEAALGRYVISGDEQVGRSYAETWARAGDQLDRLDAITADNGDQQDAIDRLRLAYAQRGDELSLTARSTAFGKDRQAYAQFYKVGRSPSLVMIERELDAITASERTLLDQRTRIALVTVKRSNAATSMLSIFGVFVMLGAIVLGWLTIGVMRERAAARIEAEYERERAEVLAVAVDEATAALRDQEAKLRQAQKMEAVGQLTGGIAHDFNNMLAVVLGGLELAKRHKDGDIVTLRRHLDNATEGADRAAALTRRLLAFSRDEALNPEAIAPGQAVAAMSDLLDRTLGGAIVIDRRDDGTDWRIRADRHELENAIINIALNARDAMEERGTLTIATRGVTLAAHEIDDCAPGDYVAIALTDTGGGMTPEVLERVFEPFFTTKPVGKGTGLGLSQIFGFARQSGGEVTIGSTPGRGTTVTLYLPRHHGAPTTTAAFTSILDDETAAPALDILLVEDDPRVLVATAGALAELGHRVVSTGDPLTAATLLAAQPRCDLVVSDVLMPGRTGPELVRELTTARPHLAALFVTGFAGEGATADFGGWPVLRKPFTIAALAQAIREATAAAGHKGADAVAAE